MSRPNPIQKLDVQKVLEEIEESAFVEKDVDLKKFVEKHQKEFLKVLKHGCYSEDPDSDEKHIINVINP